MQAALVVVVVARLVGIDEREVVAPGLAGCEAGVEGVARGSEPQVDLAGNAGRTAHFLDATVGALVARQVLGAIGLRHSCSIESEARRW